VAVAHATRLDRRDPLGPAHPYVAGEGTRLFDGFPKSYRLDLVCNTEFSNGTVTLRYRRHR
jgi:hypothetical protein